MQAVSGRLPATFAALKHPNYRRWFVGQVLSLMGTWMQSVAQGWLVYELTGSRLALGAISFVGTLPALFLMLPAGVVADRVPKRKLLIVTQASMMVFAAVLALLAWTETLQVWHIGVLAFLLGVANSFDAPARLALVSELVEDRQDLQNAIALNATMFNLARVIGPAIGGLVLAGFGAAWCFALNAASFLAVLIALLLMVLPRDVGHQTNRRMFADIGEGASFVWRHPVVRPLILLVGVASVFGFSYAVLLPAYASDVLKVDEAGYGLMNAAVGIGALTGSVTMASLARRGSKGRLLTFGSLLFPTALLGLAAVRNYYAALVCLMLVGLGFVSQNVLANTLVQTLSPDALRGRVMSFYSFMFFGTAPFGALLAGALAQRFGSSAAIVIGASITLLFSLGVIIFAPVVRRS
ncbi:MAG: MFS transporter [Anaerolineae bacterium]|jgi:MFS family permease|nr:MFS transporter [Anaerolineae bacterium]